MFQSHIMYFYNAFDIFPKFCTEIEKIVIAYCVVHNQCDNVGEHITAAESAGQADDW